MRTLTVNELRQVSGGIPSGIVQPVTAPAIIIQPSS
jgi:bacteriocin-like protein